MTAAICEHRCHLGEGPVYDAVRNRVWWVDIVEREMLELDLASGGVTRHGLPFMASAVVWIDEETQLLVAEDGLHGRDVRTGVLSFRMALEADRPGNRSNDARVHPSGALWAGTMGRQAERGAGAIYHVFEGRVTRLFGDVTIPNAMCFSPDGGTAYFTDTAVGVLNRVAVDPANGLPVGLPVPLYDHRGGTGGLDGAVTDAEGLIWNARWGAGCVDVYSPAGARVRSLAVPARQPSCPAFIGERLDRLFVTTAYQGMSADERGLDAGHGQAFIIAPEATGRLEPRATI